MRQSQQHSLSDRPLFSNDKRWAAGTWFAVFWVVHLVVWTVAPALMYYNPPGDALEGIAWGNMWLFGYDKHPPLAPWLTALFTDLFGTVGWPIYLLGQVSIVAAFWAMWRLAREIVDPWQALIAVVVLEGVYYYNLGAINYNPNVALLAAWALSSLAFYHAVRSQSVRAWGIAGICAGLAFLSKYEAAILFVVMLGILVFTPEGRSSFKSRGFYAGLLTATIVISPNLYWVVKHDFLPFHYALGNMKLEHGAESHVAGKSFYPAFSFLFEQLAALIPLFLLYLPVYKRKNPGAVIENFNRRFVLFMAAGPLLVTFLIALILRADMISRWGFPFFSFVGLALVMYVRPEITPRRLKVFFVGAGALSAVMIAGMYWMIFIKPVSSGRPPFTIRFPGPDIAAKVTQDWHEQYGRPLKYVAGDRRMVSNVAAFSPDKPIPYFDSDPVQNPWVDEASMLRDGAVFVHLAGNAKEDAELFDALRKRFPNLSVETTQTYAQHIQANVPPVVLWVAYLPGAAR